MANYTIIGTHTDQYSIYQADVTLTGESGEPVLAVYTGAQYQLYLNGNQGVDGSIYYHREIGDYSDTIMSFLWNYDSTYNISVYAIPVSVTTPLTGGDVPYLPEESTQAEARQAVRDYYDTPASATMDIRVYTQGINDKLITWVWDNIQNELPDTQYYVRFGVSDVTPGDGLLYNITEYETADMQGTISGLYQVMAEIQQANADTNGYYYVTVILGHYDLDVEWVYDDTWTFQIFIDGSGLIVDAGTGQTTPTINPDTNPTSDDVFTPDDALLEDPVAGQAMSIDNLLTRSYAMTETEIRAFGSWLWGNNITQNLFEYQTSPIENILSCKRIPFDVTGTPAVITLGNVVAPANITGAITSTSHKQTIASDIEIPAKFHDFMDYMSNISLYLPYIGIQSIPTALCYKQAIDNVTGLPYVVGREMQIVYIFDIIYGTCCAEISIKNDNNNYVMIGAFNGDCGIDIPITASSRAQNQLSIIKQGGGIGASSATAAITGSATGNIGNAISGVIGAVVGGFMNMKKETMTQDIHYATAGGFSSQIASFLPSSVMLFVEQIVYEEPAGYAHENGYPCNKTFNLNSLKGYTEIDGECEIKGIQCLDEEREGLKQALMEGFYL